MKNNKNFTFIILGLIFIGFLVSSYYIISKKSSIQSSSVNTGKIENTTLQTNNSNSSSDNNDSENTLSQTNSINESSKSENTTMMIPSSTPTTLYATPYLSEEEQMNNLAPTETELTEKSQDTSESNNTGEGNVIVY